ncbi:calcium-binding allergen Ole e 8-like [Impatiens glandulifera]|uniref:calcium-binding allergen Ole e 8-like n=1 Tax=Impatiens glandulifera TaxID=253017 RepID=UPI001FB070E2|nr:calcium-binding allergen Ole e 8-like [Impatiens glandulifera]
MASKQTNMYLQNPDEIKKVFNRFDINGDNKISVSELVDVMKALGSYTSDDEVKRMMEEIDTDHDGFINLNEFTKFCDNGDDGGLEDLKEAFELYDQDKNGLISSTELHQILSKLGEICTVQDCVAMIKSVDSDGDGFVNFDEFKKMMTNSNTTAGDSSV